MNSNTKNTVFLTFILAFLIGTIVGLKVLVPKGQPHIILNNQTIFVEVAKTRQQITQGLSGRNNLEKDWGMLFVFPQPAAYPSFWMKDMKFNLDFIFINGDRIVDLVENVPYPKAEETPQTINAKNTYDKVLETNEGTVKKLNVRIGNRVRIFAE